MCMAGKVLYFCDFCEILRPRMSSDSVIKKYKPSSRLFVEDDADYEVIAHQVKVFYPLILRAHSYIDEKRPWPEITQTMATRLKQGGKDGSVPKDYVPLQSDFILFLN